MHARHDAPQRPVAPAIPDGRTWRARRDRAACRRRIRRAFQGVLRGHGFGGESRAPAATARTLASGSSSAIFIAILAASDFARILPSSSLASMRGPRESRDRRHRDQPGRRVRRPRANRGRWRLWLGKRSSRPPPAWRVRLPAGPAARAPATRVSRAGPIAERAATACSRDCSDPSVKVSAKIGTGGQGVRPHRGEDRRDLAVVGVCREATALQLDETPDQRLRLGGGRVDRHDGPHGDKIFRGSPAPSIPRGRSASASRSRVGRKDRTRR